MPDRLIWLPTAAATFVGRNAEIAELSRKLRRTRLLTLIGPGGSGKTRLALEFLRRRSTRVAEFAWMTELTAVRDPARIPVVIARSAGMSDVVDGTRCHGVCERPKARMGSCSFAAERSDWAIAQWQVDGR